MNPLPIPIPPKVFEPDPDDGSVTVPPGQRPGQVSEEPDVTGESDRSEGEPSGAPTEHDAAAAARR